ncbi:MAG: hypothetical protein B7Z47_07040, partial [Chthoniobacter sp. 12-60-6]
MIPKFPLILTLLLGGLFAWLWTTDHTFRAAGVMLLIPLWLLLLGLWWALHRRGVRLKRLGVFVLGVIAVVAGFRFLVRYEGSADGSAMPSLAWRWQRQEKLAELKNTPGAASDPSPTPAGVADMPRFLGPKGDGVLPEPGWQTDWKAHPPREVWRIKVGEGWAGFAVAGGRAITQEQRDAQEYVTCYDIATGRLLWAHADTARFDEAMGGIGPRSTPTVDVAQNVVFTMGATGLLNCLDLSTGKVRWSKQVLKDSGATKSPEWGKSSAPLIVGDSILCRAGDDGASLIACRRSDGQVTWKAGEDGGSY